MSVEDEVNRLLSRQVIPRLPRTVPELSMALGRSMNREEMDLRRKASALGGVTLTGQIDDMLVAGADLEGMREVIEAFASDLASDLTRKHGSAVGGEVARILSDRAEAR